MKKKTLCRCLLFWFWKRQWRTQNTEAIGIAFLCSFPPPRHIFFCHFLYSNTAGTQCFMQGGMTETEWWLLGTYHSELIGRRTVLEQNVDDVGVPLLCSLVQRRVPVLQAQGKGKTVVDTANLLPPKNE